MDKRNIVQYGWIIIVVLVLSVILALSTPLGDYIGHGIVSMVKGYATTNKSAIQQENIDAYEEKYADVLYGNCSHQNTIIVDKKDATCKNNGYSGDKTCTDCKRIIEKGNILPQTEHRNVTVVNRTSANCGGSGYTGDTQCQDCKTIIVKGSNTDKLEHTLTIKNKVEATCKKEGFSGDQYCTSCNKTIIKGKTTPKTTNHSYSIDVKTASTICAECRDIIIPDNASYKKFSSCKNCGWGYGYPSQKCYSCNAIFDDYILSLTSGQKFPQNVDIGDVFTFNGYEYCFGFNFCSSCEMWSQMCGCYYQTPGWAVIAIDKSKSSYPEISETICNKPITSTVYTFAGCTSLIKSPKIPNTVKIMEYTFSNCISLTEVQNLPANLTNMRMTFSSCYSLQNIPEIPNGVTYMYYTFSDCTSLKTAPKLPQNLIQLWGTFYNCSSLVTPPTIIPSTVNDMDVAFYNCTSLTGTITINATPTYTTNTFGNTVNTIYITGSSGKLTALKNSANNGNVIII